MKWMKIRWWVREENDWAVQFTVDYLTQRSSDKVIIFFFFQENKSNTNNCKKENWQVNPLSKNQMEEFQVIWIK